jgi:DNA-binding CsgD family transcriptional regulator
MVSVGTGGLLGREAEVTQALDVLTGDAGGCVAVVGAAGMGKSALVREVAERMAAEGAAVRVTAGAVSESELPFVGLHDLIGDDVRAGSLELPGPLLDALEVAVLRTRSADAGVDPSALHLAVLRVLEQVSAQRRLLLVLDDLPWVDAATRSALAFALRRLPPDRVATLVAMRPDAPDPDLVAPGTVRTVQLAPLDATTLAAVVELRLGVRPSPRLARQLHEASGGIPLLALELARTATFNQGALAEVAVPGRYRAILGPRLEPLSPDARRALLAASLLARPTLEELADVVSVDGLVEAETAGVVRVEDGWVRFTHPLFAALCRDAAPGDERRYLHALLAKAARDEVEQGRHLGAATLLPDEGVATHLEEIAARARDRAATAAAAELMLLAERVTPRGDLDRRTARACAAGELFFLTGDVDTGAGLLRPLLGELDPGPLRARCLIVLARVISEDTVDAAALFREALGQPGLDLDLEYEIRLEVCGMLSQLGDLAGHRAGVAELEHDASSTGREELARACRAGLAWVDLMTGAAPAHSAVWHRVVAEAESYPLGYLHPDLPRAWEALSREENARALELIDGLRERAHRAGDTWLWGQLTMHRGEAELRRGHVAAACELNDLAYRSLSDGRHDAGCLYYRAIATAWRGRLDDARAMAAEALEMARRDRNRLFELGGHHALGFVELSAGQLEAAARHYEHVADGMAAMGWRNPGLVVWHGNAVEAFVATGRPAAATALTEDLDALALWCGQTTSAALARRCRGLLLEYAGDLDAAAEVLDESLALSVGLDNPLEHARTLLIRGIVHRRRRQKARSREDLRQARDTFAHHGAAAWADRADRELERSSAVTAGAGLTGAERAVAERAASGASNREIVADLYLSEKTVEAVLTRVYRKLSVRSRTQLGHHPALARTSEGHA